MGIESSVGLLVAALDLKLVRLVRAAMHNGASAAGGTGRLIRPQPVIEPRRRIEPEPQIEPRPHVRPEPVFEPREKLRGGAPALGCCNACVPPAASTEPVEKATHSPSPIEPPWKVRPWEEMRDAAVAPAVAPAVRKIKVIQVRSDIQCKGSVIDLFI